MNTAKHTTTSITKHEVKMDGEDWTGKVNRRDIGDFIHQADQEYESAMGHKVNSDDAYYVRGDEDGLTAFWTTDV